jgi:hypothetical protein
MKGFKLKRSEEPRSSGSGAYGHDLGNIAFSDPLELIGKKAAAREKSRLAWKAQGGKRKRPKKDTRKDMHLKHG